MDYKVVHERILTTYHRLDEELTQSIRELITEAKKGNEDDTLEFLATYEYFQSPEDENPDVLFGFNLITGEVSFSNDSKGAFDVPLEEMTFQMRLDLLKELSEGSYTTYKEEEA